LRNKQEKEEYVLEHPEQRKLVYRAKKQQYDTEKPLGGQREISSIKRYSQETSEEYLLRSSDESLGFPPPGMPYIERCTFSSMAFSQTSLTNCLSPPPGRERK
jgi:hypothetical protein